MLRRNIPSFASNRLYKIVNTVTRSVPVAETVSIIWAEMQRQSWNVKNVRTTTATKTRFYGRPPTIAATMAAPLVNCPKMLSHVLLVGLASGIRRAAGALRAPITNNLDAQTFVGFAWEKTLTTPRSMELVTGVAPRSDVRCQVILIEA